MDRCEVFVPEGPSDSSGSTELAEVPDSLLPGLGPNGNQLRRVRYDELPLAQRNRYTGVPVGTSQPILSPQEEKQLGDHPSNRTLRDGFTVGACPGNKLPGIRRAQSSRYEDLVPSGQKRVRRHHSTPWTTGVACLCLNSTSADLDRGLVAANPTRTRQSRIEFSETSALEIFCSSSDVRNPACNKMYYESDYCPFTCSTNQAQTFSRRQAPRGPGDMPGSLLKGAAVDIGARSSGLCNPFFPEYSMLPRTTKSRWVERSPSRLLHKGRAYIDAAGKAPSILVL